jgi:hypothetical protein
VFVGNSARVAGQQHKLAPRTTERTLAGLTKRLHLTRRAQPPTVGNLYEPFPADDGVHGRWHSHRRTALRRAATVGLAAAGVAAARRDRET